MITYNNNDLYKPSLNDYRSEQTQDVSVNCITLVPGFQHVCLDHNVLETAYFQYKQEHGALSGFEIILKLQMDN